MIRIDNITRGRWGNKIFQYNNLIQLAHKLNIESLVVVIGKEIIILKI